MIARLLALGPRQVVERLLTLGPRGRLVMFVILVSVSVAAALQLPRLQIDRGDERLVGANDPGWAALRQMQKDFGAEQSVMVYLIDTGRPGDIFGEIGFAGESVQRTATITALEPVTAVKIEAARSHKGLRLYPRIATRLYRNIGNVLGTRLLEAHQRLLRSVHS